MTVHLRPRPRPVPLSEVAALLGASAPGFGSLAVTGVTLDSRSVEPGDIYAALPGHITHGVRFARAALADGAVAILTDRDGAAELHDVPVPLLVCDDPRAEVARVAALVYGHPAASLQLLGVTGTNGKTTVAAMVESGLHAAGRVTGTIGTTGVRIADVAFAGARTTPEATDLQALFALMLERGVQSVVMEVSSIAVVEHRIDALTYDVAAFTNLSQDHLDYHGSMEEYFLAKAALFTPGHARLGVIGVDDEWGRRLAQTAPIEVDTWSLVDMRATWSVRRTPDGVVVSGPDGDQPVDMPMPGAFNVANAVCAFAMLRRAGVTGPDAARGIAQTRVPGRMQLVRGPRGIRGYVDYAHSPDAIERVLRAAREATEGRVIAVVGAGGDRDRGKRPQMGLTAAQLANVVVITDDNPRSEDPAAIRAAVLEGALSASPATRGEVLEVADRRSAITVAVGAAESGDVVLVLGKGHEQGQDVGGIVAPFDDVTVLAEAFAAAGDVE